MADGARSACDQDGLSGDWAIGEDAAVSGHGGYAQAGGGREVRVPGQADGVPAGLDGVLGPGAKGPAELGLEQPDPLPDP